MEIKLVTAQPPTPVRFATQHTSVDHHPWEHPFLVPENIAYFRQYSERVWEIALNYASERVWEIGRNYSSLRPPRLRCAFSVNMAQNMYKWACLARSYGTDATLFTHPLDETALSMPEWEEFDGEFGDVMDGSAFLTAHSTIELRVPHERIAMGDFGLLAASNEHKAGNPARLRELRARFPHVRYEALLAFEGFYPYYDWARALSAYDVIYCAGAPFAAYASGRPYCLFSVGGDLQYDCGRADAFGQATRVSFETARFLMTSNPHTLGHARRLGLVNAVYLPYPMDDSRYCSGVGRARREWHTRYGGEVFALTSCRLDSSVKGYGQSLFDIIVEAASMRPQLRFIFLGWGNSAAEFRARINAAGMQKQLIVLPAVGKKRLIDYYRSSDLVLDQFVYGYYGATALEAAAVGKPVIMKLRTEHYAPLYAGDVAPVFNASEPKDVRLALLALVDNMGLRVERGRIMREWLVRNHGEARTVPLMLALLELAADRVPLPADLVSPLMVPETEREQTYHEACRQRTE